ncbi:hypothetical protein H2198_007664 [Neophaeococcomyces mojaviensis]|uniref:Uncharacterized protein n=1 Tax=Neophaeococcomyces mojaviensis TaxID=3383035 RepID=A0ACC2ZZG6_9EURO|nr:hypothetical protein H2198_007664 [Knufia sp. JES_112]
MPSRRVLAEIPGNSRRGKELNPFQRSQIAIYHDDGCTHEEIATKVGTKPKTVTSTLRLAPLRVDGKSRPRSNVANKESTADEEYKTNLSGLQQAASGTTPVQENLLVKVSGSYYGHVHLTENSYAHLGDAYHRHKGKVSLKFVEEAIFDAYNQTDDGFHADTRVDLLRSIQDWAHEVNGKSIFWLNGMAGTGKSTISRTIAEWLVGQRSHGDVDLGASFFFKRGKGDRASAVLFIPTVVHQLRLKVLSLSDVVEKAIETDPEICHKSLGEQFDRLLRKPVQALNSQRLPTYIIVVDALDESYNGTDIRSMLKLRSSSSQILVPIARSL